MFFPSNVFYYMSRFDNLAKLTHVWLVVVHFLEVLNQNLNLKFHQMNFWFELFDIHMNEKIITCHDCRGFKWQNINIYPILIIFLWGPTPFLACWIMNAPSCPSTILPELMLTIWLNAFPLEGKPSILPSWQMLSMKQFFGRWPPPFPFFFPCHFPWLTWLVVWWYPISLGGANRCGIFFYRTIPHL